MQFGTLKGRVWVYEDASTRQIYFKRRVAKSKFASDSFQIAQKIIRICDLNSNVTFAVHITARRIAGISATK